nr:pentatricopeptide repeat-containing protein At4g14820 [Ipomoea batatas]
MAAITTASVSSPLTTIAPGAAHPRPLSTAISSAASLSHLKQIHAQIFRNNLHRSNSLLLDFVLSSLPFSSDYALAVFFNIHNPEPHLCNKLLRKLSRSREPRKAFLVFGALRKRGFSVDRFGFPPLLKAASNALALVEGREIHGLGCKLGYDSDPFVQTALLGMYASCGLIPEARQVFDKMSYRDVVTWDIMIDGYCESGLFDDALSLLEEMKSSGVETDERIFTTILSSCARARNLAVGKLIHNFVSENDIAIDSQLQTALVNMYASCGSMDVAQSLYDELSPKNVVASTAMLFGYSKVGRIEAARLIFDQMASRDLVCWSAMISGYAESDQPQEALKLFNEMQAASRIRPDQVAMLSVISACANLGALDQAKHIHMFVKKNGFEEDLRINNALIDMYGKCGSLDGAIGVFDRMHRKNVISWTSMINAFAMHGDANNALLLFNQMKHEKVEPNGVTFLGLLYACSHAGLVEEGQKMFSSMVNEYGLVPKHEHYGCMVDLYGRANLLKEALMVIESMPMSPNVVIWGSLMAACRIHGEFELGEFAAKQILVLEPDHSGAHVLLSNIYAKERRWGNVREVRKLMTLNDITKEHGCSKIEINREIHEFLTADRSHKQADEIYAKLDIVVDKLKEAGYAPDTSSVLLDLDEDEKRDAILWHSEKLAFCYGLMNSERGSCIRIIKNLRVCEDCHNFMKLASRVFDRKIVMRDRTRFHQYADGLCSCKDFW